MPRTSTNVVQFNAPQFPVVSQISYDDAIEWRDEMEVTDKQDTGGVQLYAGLHPDEGDIIIVTGCLGTGAFLIRPNRA